MRIYFFLLFATLLLTACKFVSSNIEPNNTESITEYTKFVIEDYDSIFKSKYSESWNNHDTLLYSTIIDSLTTLEDKRCIIVCYNLSEETGFGYSLVDIDNLTWYDTLSNEKKERVLKMIIGGFQVYKKSNLFMKRLPYVISLHLHLNYNFQWDEKNRERFFKELEIYSNKVAKCTKTWPDNTAPDMNWEPVLDCD